MVYAVKIMSNILGKLFEHSQAWNIENCLKLLGFKQLKTDHLWSVFIFYLFMSL